MLRKHFSLALTLAAIVGLSLAGTPTPAIAGCGCDHPPPAPAAVMPAFGGPGKTILLTAPDAGFQAGDSYDVQFDVPSSGDPGITTSGTALNADTLRVEVPQGAAPGPAEITVEGAGSFSQSFPSSAFTVLDTAPVVAAEGGAFERVQYRGAVTTDGTLLLPLNVRHVQDGMQLAFQFEDLPLEYDVDDVVIYNADGVDLTLFTLAVEGQTAMEWGSYYGWDVEGDTNLSGPVYDHKVHRATDKDRSSDVLTYWRHEFVTYTDAHLAGGEHAIDEMGYHADGTLHINHGHLVIAINGMKRSSGTLAPLEPGKKNVTVRVLAISAADPIEPNVMLDAIENETGFVEFDPDEDHYDEFEGMSPSGGDEEPRGGKGKKK